MNKALSGVVVGSVALLMATQAMAQAQENFFARDRNVSVRERARPGYQALGLPLGSFIAYPKLELGVQDNSNIYGQPNNAKSDVIGMVDPEVDLVSQWARNKLSAFVRSATREYDRYTGEDTTDWQLGGLGQIYAGDSTVNFGGDYGYLAEPRTAAISGNSLNLTTKHPVEYYQSDANLGLVHTFNRLQLSGGVVYQEQDFQNGANPLGGTVVETPFNHNQTTGQVRAAYAVSPDTALYVAATYDTINYPNQVLAGGSLNRNSTGETYNVGTNFDITQLVRGDVELGVLQQNFANSTHLGTVTGFNALGKVEWFPTQLTTVTFTGSRALDPATVPGSPAMVASAIGGQIDHELLRNLILTGMARYEQDSYQGIQRQDDISELTVMGDYLLNRNIGLHLAYDYLTQDSTGLNRGLNFNVNKITLSTTLQY